MRCGCEKVKGADFHKKLISFEGRSFYWKKIPLFFHTPIGLEERVEALIDEIELKEYKIVEPWNILQRDGTFTGRIMAEINPPRFFDPQIFTFEKDEVFTFVSTKEWKELTDDTAEAKRLLEGMGKKARNVYLNYRSCPKCSEFDGYQTVIILEPQS